ncbi:hypothetical protein EXU85_03870 [Spirosoma sp. KCTC 42546]|uniref:hypothetical protein n=1 Tax=Spirosoma sp. KCTC 42546 TaxID=2520506 RepID=UPI001159B4D5|nr:hypothetical protein [Spirosoma sp. KCTC 42546]QDK77776.1 hypothetical protein EXU85_03870 [Spirosoma sp. KCTC 42546]
MLAFFSSDSRHLYKEDIFEVMSLPVGYVVHFRYDKQWINLDEKGIENTHNQEGIIFFSVNNHLAQAEEERQIEHKSIRKAKVVKCTTSDKTGLVHYYLQLGEFVECSIEKENPINKPPHKFLSDLNINDIKNKQWHERVSAIKSSFPNQLFLNISIENKKNETISPIFDSKDNNNYFTLSDESTYQLKISFFDVYEENKTSESKDADKVLLEIESNKNHIEVDINKKYAVGAVKDDQNFLITTQSLSVQSLFTSLKFLLNNNSSTEAYDFFIRVKIERVYYKTLLFGFYSLLVASGVSLMTYLARTISIKDINNWILSLLILITFICVTFGAQMLYKAFNKK